VSETKRLTYTETPLFFQVGGESLFGLLTNPHRSALGTAVVALNAGGYQSSAHRNRFYVNICRGVAEDGYHGFRFDYHGVGESTGRVDYYKLDEPFLNDLDGAIEVLRDRGLGRFVLLGFCFGGRTALSGATQIDGVEAVIMISSPPQDIQEGEGPAARRTISLGFWQYLREGLRLRVLRRFFSRSARKQFRQAWLHLRMLFRSRLRRFNKRSAGEEAGDPLVGAGLLGPLEEAVSRGLPVLFVYGADDPFVQGFHSGRLGELVRRSNGLVGLLTIEGTVAPARTVWGQAQILEVVRDWLARRRTESGTFAQA
jgi:pimeloyl-ACP methyl ester carboxylesterase